MIQNESGLLDTDLLPIRAAVEIHQLFGKLHQRIAAMLHPNGRDMKGAKR